ncbi:hypothetical protein RUND412_006903 [Rhizina undulata]
MTKLSIEIVSDTVCPWCYVGHKKLTKAISQFTATNPSHTFDITWKPYQLNPTAPKTSVDKTTYFTSKFGEARTSQIFQRLAAVGAAEGIDFKFGGKTGNTRDSHRLIELGREKGVQTKVVEELFKAYFEEEKDITDHAVLVDAGKKAGLDEGELKRWLEGDLGGEVVDKEIQVAQLHGISGVPNFTINGKVELGGAQDSAEFVKAFKSLAK